MGLLWDRSKKYVPGTRDETGGGLGYYVVIVNDKRTRVYAHHRYPDIAWQAYRTLSPASRAQAVVLYASSPDRAKKVAEEVLDVVR